MLHFILSTIVAIFALAAVFVAKKAMERGLTYSAISATVWALSFIAVSRILHTLREVLNLEAKWGDWPEFIEYALLIAAFAVFIRLAGKSIDLKTP